MLEIFDQKIRVNPEKHRDHTAHCYHPERPTELADLVTEMKEFKHSYAAGINALKGIEYRKAK